MSDVGIAVIGLGYVGLPLAVALSHHFPVSGFDIDPGRCAELRAGVDRTGEIDEPTLKSTSLKIIDDTAELRGHNVFIVTVPTPVDASNRPDLSALVRACETVGGALERGAVVVFESTVFPGATEERCAPVLEAASGLRCGTDFTLGYSPERINPGDREHRVDRIVKVVAGQDQATLDLLTDLYGKLTSAGVHRAPSIKVAEAAKVLENTQRDLNIALMNELSKICELMGISTADVLAAAGTKWNFLRFHPGLVGGHCIGVDPYYLTAKAEELGYQPEVILAGRRINDGMGAYVARQIAKQLARSDRPLSALRVAVLGLTFKEDVPDVRNSQVLKLVRELRDYGIEPMVHDPVADAAEVERDYGVTMGDWDDLINLDAMIVAVPHAAYRVRTGELIRSVADGGLVADLRSAIDPAAMPASLRYWSL